MLFDKVKTELISQSLLGMSFKIGGRGEDGCIDCYGVLTHFFKEFGINLPDYSYAEDWCGKTDLYLQEYAKFFRKLGKDENLEIGDMILFYSKETANHAGVYLGGERFIHAYNKTGTRIDTLTNKLWKTKVYGYFRVREEKQ